MTDPPRDLLDADRVAACRANPQRGPRILFLSGGTALRGLSRSLTDYTHCSIHLITPFDSGGSSAHLRRAFDMPSVGDLRNRLLALAPGASSSESAIHRALSHRLPLDARPEELHQLLRDAAAGDTELTSGLADDVGATLRQHLGYLVERLPADFDPRGANVGNLLLAASYLAHGRDLDSAIDEFAGLLHPRGTVCPTAAEDAQLVARLVDGTRVVGQHLLTGKEAPPLSSPIEDLWLVASGGDADTPADVPATDRARALLADADLICFPTGSFFSSLLANLLPTGIGRALVDNPCPKVYVPNTGVDPEQTGMSVRGCVDSVVRTIRHDAGDAVPIGQILDVVLLDQTAGHYAIPVEHEALAATGVEVRTTNLVSSDVPSLDPRRLAEVLVSIAGWGSRPRG